MHTKHAHTHHQLHACTDAQIHHKPPITHMLAHRALTKTTGRHAHKTRTHHQPHACTDAQLHHKSPITHMLVHRALPKATGRQAHKTHTHTSPTTCVHRCTNTSQTPHYTHACAQSLAQDNRQACTQNTHTHHQPHACTGARIPYKPRITHMLAHRALPRTTGTLLGGS